MLRCSTEKWMPKNKTLFGGRIYLCILHKMWMLGDVAMEPFALRAASWCQYEFISIQVTVEFTFQRSHKHMYISGAIRRCKWMTTYWIRNDGSVYSVHRPRADHFIIPFSLLIELNGANKCQGCTRQVAKLATTNRTNAPKCCNKQLLRRRKNI